MVNINTLEHANKTVIRTKAERHEYLDKEKLHQIFETNEGETIELWVSYQDLYLMAYNFSKGYLPYFYKNYMPKFNKTDIEDFLIDESIKLVPMFLNSPNRDNFNKFLGYWLKIKFKNIFLRRKIDTITTNIKDGDYIIDSNYISANSIINTINFNELLEILTLRERAILNALSQGNNVSDIANNVGISRPTVYKDFRSINQKITNLVSVK